jgi:hypothetical protein
VTEHRNWLEIPEVVTQMQLAAEWAGKQAAAQFAWSAQERIGFSDWFPFESPLEAMFWLWWEAATHGCGRDSYGGRLDLSQQREVEAGGQRYRLDFVVGVVHETVCRYASVEVTFPKIAVEVDGHGFHEKTPEQVAWRNQRDRALQQDGWIVFHFSWSEVIENGARCVDQVVSHAIRCLQECDKEAWIRHDKRHPEAVNRAIESLRSEEQK